MKEDQTRPREARAQRIEELLPQFSLDRRISIVVLIATLLVLGVVATISIPLELIPGGFSESFLRVAAPWSDAPPQEVLDKIVLPLEEELATVSGLSNMFSFARNGFGQVFLTFKHGTDMDVAYREVRDRVERARLNMPDDLEQVFIRKDDSSSVPVAMVGVAVEEGTADVYNLIENEVKLQIERIDGVANVQVQGLVEKEILIELDRERVEAAGLNIYEIAQDLARDNFTMASGNVRSGDRKLLLRSVARFSQPDSIRELQVTPTVRLGDIATISYEQPDSEFSVRVNSKPAYAIAVSKEGEANTLEVATAVSDLVSEKLANNPRLASLEIDLFMDQGSLIRESLATLLNSGRVGAIFAMLVLFFFLRRFRLSLIVALSIPLSMVVALVTMYFAGESLNILSLLGLMISIGLLVDNSVVVAENIHRLYREEGAGRREAAIRGAGEIALAITTATLTTIIVFLPVALVEGQGQFFLLRLAIPISVSLAASLFVALVVVPLGVFLSLPRQADRAAERAAAPRWRRRIDGWMEAGYERSFGLLNRLYGRALSYFLNRRFDLILALIAVFALTQLATRGRVDIVPMAEEDQAFLSISVEMPDNLSFAETESWFRSVENRIAEHSEELALDFYMVFHQREYGEIQAALAKERTNGLSAREVTERLLDLIPEMPGAEFSSGMASEAEDGEDLATETVRLYGEDAAQLDEVMKGLREVLVDVPGIVAVKRDEERAPKELALQLDRDLTQRQGVNPQVLAGVVGYALRGQPLSRVYLGGRDIPVRLRFEEEDRNAVAQLGNFSVPNAMGERIAIGSLVDVRNLPTASTIFRRNKQTSRAITLELEEDAEQDAREAIYARLARIDLPEGVSLAPLAARGAQSDEAKNLQFAAILSIVFVYLLMGFLFESFMLPLSILITIPLANLGVGWAHLIAGRDRDFLGLVGVVILIGVVVNNGIVLLDYVRRLRDRGYERTQALLVATQRRFRPIMMTALTTICGMVPLTLGEPMEMGLSYKSFGLTLIGGMVTSSLLTLLVVPVFYTLFEDARSAMSRAALAGFTRGGAARKRGGASAGDLGAADASPARR